MQMGALWHRMDLVGACQGTHRRCLSIRVHFAEQLSSPRGRTLIKHSRHDLCRDHETTRIGHAKHPSHVMRLVHLMRLTSLLGVAFLQSSCNLAPAKPDKATVSIRWTDVNFGEELTAMFPCDVVGLEVVTTGYAPHEPVEVKIALENDADEPEIVHPVVDHQGIARMHFQARECREDESHPSSH